MTKDESLRLALEALTDALDKPMWNRVQMESAITAIKATLEANEFNPDWDTQAVLVEEIQRMAKRIEELEAQGEPVAWRWMPAPYWKQWVYSDDGKRVEEAKRFMGDGGVQPLYTTPSQRKPLTDEEIQEIVSDASRAGTLSWTGYKEDDEGKYTIPVLSLSDYQFARAIEAKLKEKT